MVIAAPAISWRVFNGYAAGNHACVAKPVGRACRWKPSNRASEHETRRSRFETRSRHLNPHHPNPAHPENRRQTLPRTLHGGHKVVLRRPLVGVAHLNQQRLGEMLTDELDAQGQPFAVQSGWQ